MPRVVLAKPMIRHERAAVLREIFDSLDDGGRPRHMITNQYILFASNLPAAGPQRPIAVRPPTARKFRFLCRGPPRHCATTRRRLPDLARRVRAPHGHARRRR